MASQQFPVLYVINIVDSETRNGDNYFHISDFWNTTDFHLLFYNVNCIKEFPVLNSSSFTWVRQCSLSCTVSASNMQHQQLKSLGLC